MIEFFKKTSKISYVAMETPTVAMDSEEPSDRSQPKLMTLFIYRTEIDKVEPKLWGFTCVTIILGHPV